jgi:predicted methyltransferase
VEIRPVVVNSQPWRDNDRMKTHLDSSFIARRRTILALPLALAFISCASAATPSSALQDAIASPLREPKAKARDTYRHPAETLQFFELKPDQTVIEIAPGAGWYTDILAPYLNAAGTLYEAQYLEPGSQGDDGEARMRAAFEKKLAATPAVYGKVKVGTLQGGNFGGFGGSVEGKADRVLTFRNIHNWMEDGQLDANLRAFHAALKPGGILGVEEHRAIPGTPLQKMIDTGYVTEAYVIDRVTAAGFALDGKSEINSNPRDTKDYPNGVWSLPPTYRGGDNDRARFAAIGESDRMTLRFIKR